MILVILIAAGLVYAWWKGDKAMSFDEIFELRFLKSRQKQVTYKDIQPMLAKRGICGNFGKYSPWTSKKCECTGYEFAKWKRGIQYCKCGCGMLGHLFTKRTEPKAEVDPDTLDAAS